MKKISYNKFILCILVCYLNFQNLNAQMLSNAIIYNRSNYYGGLSFTDIDYKSHTNINNKIIFGGANLDLYNNTNLFTHVGFIYDSSIDSLDDGKGIILGLGLKELSIKYNKPHNIHINIYGLVNCTMLNFKKSLIKLDLSIMDLHIGGIAYFYKFSQSFIPYGGLEIIPYSNGTVKSNSYKEDIERDDLINFKIGGTLKLETFQLRLGVTLIGEQTFILAIST